MNFVALLHPYHFFLLARTHGCYHRFWSIDVDDAVKLSFETQLRSRQASITERFDMPSSTRKRSRRCRKHPEPLISRGVPSASFSDATRSRSQSHVILASSDRGADADQYETSTSQPSTNGDGNEHQQNSDFQQSSLNVYQKFQGEANELSQHELEREEVLDCGNGLGGASDEVVQPNLGSTARSRPLGVGAMYQDGSSSSSDKNDDSDSDELMTYIDQSVLQLFEGRDDDVNEDGSTEEEKELL